MTDNQVVELRPADISEVLALDATFQKTITDLGLALDRLALRDRFFNSLRNKALFRVQSMATGAAFMHSAIEELCTRMSERDARD